jgi:hypothetical protein
MAVVVKRVVIRNKMMYPVRVTIGINENDKRTYAKVAGKSTLGPKVVSNQVFTIIKEDPSLEVIVK